MSTLHIDWTRCAGHGACVELLEGTLTADDRGYPLGAGGRDIPIPRGRERDARDAVALCPRLALTLRESEEAGVGGRR